MNEGMKIKNSSENSEILFSVYLTFYRTNKGLYFIDVDFVDSSENGVFKQKKTFAFAASKDRALHEYKRIKQKLNENLSINDMLEFSQTKTYTGPIHGNIEVIENLSVLFSQKFYISLQTHEEVYYYLCLNIPGTNQNINSIRLNDSYNDSFQIYREWKTKTKVKTNLEDFFKLLTSTSYKDFNPQTRKTYGFNF